jgi:hypothetical protein
MHVVKMTPVGSPETLAPRTQWPAPFIARVQSWASESSESGSIKRARSCCDSPALQHHPDGFKQTLVLADMKQKLLPLSAPVKLSLKTKGVDLERDLDKLAAAAAADAQNSYSAGLCTGKAQALETIDELRKKVAEQEQELLILRQAATPVRA